MSRFRRIIQSSNEEDDDASFTAVDESTNMSINSSISPGERRYAVIESSDDEEDPEESTNSSVNSSTDQGEINNAKKVIENSDNEDSVPIQSLDASTNQSQNSTTDHEEISKIIENTNDEDSEKSAHTTLNSSKEFENEASNPAEESADMSLKDIPEHCKGVVESSGDESEDGFPYPRSQVVQSPPKILPKPLARSSVLPVQPVRVSTRLLPVPQEMLQPRKTLEKSDEVIVLDDSDVIEDSGSEVWQRRQKESNAEVMVIEESDNFTSTTGSLHAPSFSSTEQRNNYSSNTNKTGSLKNSLGLNKSSKIDDSDNSAATNKTGSVKSLSASAASTASSFSSTNSSTDSQSEMRRLKQQVEEKALALRSLEHAYQNCDLRKLNDGGVLLRKKMECCRLELAALKNRYKIATEGNDDIQVLGSVKQNIIFSTKDQKTAHLGEKGLQTHRVETALTLDGLVSLHGSLAKMPAEDAEETDPVGLKVELMSHQRQALAWLLHRENQTPAGGILADDMGLGKTLTMIALVMKSAEIKTRNEENEKPSWQSSSSDKKHPGKTLVVCPASLIGQWESQIKQHVRGSRLTVMLHHGSSREGRGRELTRPDIVITTYGILAQDMKSRVAAFRVAWERIILDEAHQIRNHKTQAAIAVCELEAKYRWCLTGTPFHNKQLDVYSLLKFLRCKPFDDLNVWKRWVDNKRAEGTERLNTIIKSILLRRTKEELKSQGKLNDLPAKELHDVRVELDEQEFSVYETVLKFSQKLVARYLAERAEAVDGGLMAPRIQQLQRMVQKVEDVKTHEILVLLLRLRQICCLPGLISAMLEEDEAALADGFEKPDPVVESLFKQVRRLTISAPPPPDERPSVDVTKVLVTSNPVFDMQRSSSKMKTILGTIKKILDSGDKVVVVSQWSSFLRQLASHLKFLPFKIATLDGQVPVKSRGALVDEFNDQNSKLRLLLLSLTAGGVGLNLIGANHLVIMEPHWNPQLEAQACDRVYRVGQKKPVHIYKVICKQTIEEQIEQLQKVKLSMANKVLSGELKRELTKLSLQDLRSLFNL